MFFEGGRSLQELKVQIDQIPDLRGAGIAYIGEGVCTVLRMPVHTSGLKTFVIVQTADLDDETPSAPDVQKPDIRTEMVGAGLNCAGALLSWGALTGEALAAPISGGASLSLTLITWSAALSTSVSCANSILRSVDIGVNHGQWTRWLDSNEYYEWASYALDVVSLVGAAASTSAALRAASAIRRATGRSWMQILKTMTRADRKRLAQEIIRLQYPGVSSGAIKDLIRLGKFPAKLRSAEVTEKLFVQLKDAVSAALSYSASAVAGNLKLFYLHVYQD